MSTQRDELILKLQKQIEEKKNKIVKPTHVVNKTNLTFKYNPDSKPLNLNTQDVDSLVNIFGFLTVQDKTYYTARYDLGLPNKIFKHEGFSIGEWYNDIQNCITKLTYKNEIQSLSVLEAKLANLESDDLKKDKELDAIMKELGG